MEKRLFGTIVILLLMLSAFYGLYRIFDVSDRYTLIKKYPIEDVDLSRVSDGDYTGEFIYNDFIYAALAEEITQSVVSAQSLQVDSVTYATTTSKALLKAIEEALKKGIKE